jgi:hypothetical protein
MKKLQAIRIRVNEEEKAAIDSLAKSQGLTMSALLRSFAIRQMNEQKKAG